MKRTLIFFVLAAFMVSVSAQDEATQKKSNPVRFTFGTGILIENQTVATPYKGGLELQIQHRFSLIENYHNLFGIYGAANTRLGLNYGITERLMVAVGTTKDYKLQDLAWKYLILRQNEDNSMPVSLAYYGNIVADLRQEDAFGPVERFKDIHRLSYFTQLILARKFNDVFSLQVAPSFVYFNAVPLYANDQRYKNWNIGLSAGAKATIVGAHSLILEYDQLLTKQNLDQLPDNKPQPNLAIGWEIDTATHSFEVFATNYSQIVSQRNLVFNTNDFTKGDYMFGFNITVRF
jgi:hypothetical protein